MPDARIGPAETEWIPGGSYDPGLRYKKADLHLHSHFSYDVLNLPAFSPRTLYDTAVRRGMGFFALTDHDTLLGYQALRKELAAEFGDEPPIPLIPGIEITVRDEKIGHTIHVNVLGLDEGQMLELARRRRDLGRFLAFCRSEDLYHIYNHAFWFKPGELGRRSVVEGLIPEFPLIEINAARIPQLNSRTLGLARKFDKQIVATSDSHTGNVGRAYTMAPGNTTAEFLSNLRKGVSIAAPAHATFSAFTREVAETIELVFLRSTPFRMKDTVLRTMPVARWIARKALQSKLFMNPSPVKPAACRALQLLAYPPACAFIYRQMRINGRLGETEA
jgi:predicted metal-dependent phosphoesterase TrpH